MTNHLYYGDNLVVLRHDIADESVDLIYLDPPFNSNASYNVLFKSPTGQDSEAQLEAFEDTWHWGNDTELRFDEVVNSGNVAVADMLNAMWSFLGENDMMAYLTMMAVRMLELHRVLKPTGSLYLHCDPTASHYLKILLDAVFGATCYRTEISWRRSSAHSDAKQGRKQYGNVRDVIFYYTKGKSWSWNWMYTEYDAEYISQFYRHIDSNNNRKYRADNLMAAKPGGDVEYEWRVKRPIGGEWVADLDNEWKNPRLDWEYKGVPPYQGRYWAYSKDKMKAFAKDNRLVYAKSGMPSYKRYLDEMPGVPLQNDWRDIAPALGKQDLGYPTQKPLALLERIIEASSNEGDVVMDPFCGCGTAVHAAQKLGRHWIGIDVTHLAISLIEKRLNDAFPGIQYEVHGTPKDIGGAKALADLDKHQFEWWAVSLVNAQPSGNKKKGADKGIDGVIYFRPDGKTYKKAVVSVKGGKNIGVGMVRDLRGVLEREKDAEIGLFLTLSDPTQPMKTEAASAGIYQTDYGKYPRVQILTIEELLHGKKPELPLVDQSVAFKQARREEDQRRQGKLDI